MYRVEVRSVKGNFYLGYVFDDGLKEFGGLRYCINFVFFKFILRENMEVLGYGEYLKFFE